MSGGWVSGVLGIGAGGLLGAIVVSPIGAILLLVIVRTIMRA